MTSASALVPINFKNFSFQELEIEQLPGFSEDTLHDACLAWQRSVAFLKPLPFETEFGASGTRAQWEEVLNVDIKKAQFHHFLKTYFKAYHLFYEGHSKGLFTGYFEPCLKASNIPTPEFQYPIYQRPSDLIVIEDLGRFHPALAGYRIAGSVHEKTLKPYFSRRDLSLGTLNGCGLEIAWVADKADLYFMHIQGSGKLEFDKEWRRLSYDGTNGYPYTSIGKVIIEQGYLKPGQATMMGIKQWLRENPTKMDEILYQNESFVFFRDLGTQEGPIGRQGSILTPKRSLAVDPRVISMGMPLWLSAEAPCASERPLQRFMVAQDVGGAIKGPIRGDFYWGTGEQAGELAGTMKSAGELYFLVPKTIKFKGFLG